MAQATFSVRMDEGLKKQFDKLCAEFGMNTSVAVNVFARAVVRERRIPFEIAAPDATSKRAQALDAFHAIREESKRNFPQGMSLEEINDEIAKTRLDMEEEK